MILNSFQKNIISAINNNYQDINHNTNLDARKLLWSIAGCESSFGIDNDDYYEKNFDLGGKYWNDNLKGLKAKYGVSVCCSQGVWQLLYITAYELGYRGLPRDLVFPDIQIEYVIRYINIRLKGFRSLCEFADGYNSGSFKDKHIPHKYIAKFKRIYDNTDERIFYE